MALIDKDSLKANIIKRLGISGEEYLLPAERVLWNVINAEPTQEIIHCKDCKHHWTHRCMDSIPTEICDLNQTFYDAEVDFCSLAEKRG